MTVENNKRQTRVYAITANKEELDILESLFKTMQSMGIAGSSREIKLFVDGDGAFRPRFKRLIPANHILLTEEDLERIIFLTEVDIESIIPGNTDKETIVHGDGLVKRDCEEFNGDGWWVYYDFG